MMLRRKRETDMSRHLPFMNGSIQSLPSFSLNGTR